MMLANRFTNQNVDGWWCSEKFDGVRAFWDGTAIRTRTWREIDAPSWFKALLPAGVAIDGELWAGRGTFQQVSELSRFSRSHDPIWHSVRIMAFDWPTTDAMAFEERIAALSAYESTALHVVRPYRIASGAEAVAKMATVVADGGEGLVLKRPGYVYEFGRSSAWLKVKPATVD